MVDAIACPRCGSEDLAPDMEEEDEAPEAKRQRNEEQRTANALEQRKVLVRLIKKKDTSSVKRVFGELGAERVAMDVDCKVLATPDEEGNTLLHAVPQEANSMLNFLLAVRASHDGPSLLLPNPNAVNKLGETRLHLTESRKDAEMLLNIGCDLMCKDAAGLTPLMRVQKRITETELQYHQRELKAAEINNIRYVGKCSGQKHLRYKTDAWEAVPKADERKTAEKALERMRKHLDGLQNAQEVLPHFGTEAYDQAASAFQAAAAGDSCGAASSSATPCQPFLKPLVLQIAFERAGVFYSGTEFASEGIHASMEPFQARTLGTLRLRKGAKTIEFERECDALVVRFRIEQRPHLRFWASSRPVTIHFQRQGLESYVDYAQFEFVGADRFQVQNELFALLRAGA
jgi:hypothetical protein